MKFLALCLLIAAGTSLILESTRGQEVTQTAENSCNETADGIQFDELKEGLESDKIVLIDVRNRDELTTEGAIAKGNNIPLPELEEAFSLGIAEFKSQHGFAKPTPDLKGNFVLSCRSGVRALHAWRALNKLGFCEARVYYGSFNDWIDKGGPLQA